MINEKSNLKKFYDIHEVQKQWVFIYNKLAECIFQFFNSLNNSETQFINSHPTTLSYPPPYELAKNGQRYWYHAYNKCNTKLSILVCFFIL